MVVHRSGLLASRQDVGGDEHDGRDQEEDAGDEAGEGERLRQGRPARAETQRTEDRLREGLYTCLLCVLQMRKAHDLSNL